MSEYLKKICRDFVFILLLLYVVDLLFGVVFSNILESIPDGRFYKINYTLNESKEDVLVLGSSKAETNFVPYIFEDKLKMTCWNGGRGGQGLLYFRAMQEAVLSRHKPKVVILHLSNYVLANNYVSDKISILKPFYHKNPEIKPFVNEISEQESYLMYSNIYQYNSNFYYFFRSFAKKGIDGDLKDKGWKPRIGKIKQENVLDYEREIIHESDYIKPRSVEELEKMLKSFISSSVKIFVVSAPSFRPINAPRNEAKLKKLLQKHNITYIDLSKDEDFIHKAELFKDFGHLNKEGAIKFSEKVSELIKNNFEN